MRSTPGRRESRGSSPREPSAPGAADSADEPGSLEHAPESLVHSREGAPRGVDGERSQARSEDGDRLLLPAAGAAAKERLPDLDPDAPEGVNVLRPDDEPGRSYLTFGTVVYNVGKGPLIVRGHRASASDPTVVADQAVQDKGGGERIFSGVGTIRYDADDEYERWGLESFLRYELRRADNRRIVGRSSAADWCVVDFRHLERRKRLRGEPGGPVFRDRCHEDDPEALELEMGISVGWGNFHRSFRKGQVIDITDLATGQYVLVYRANPRKALHESAYRNNASSALLSIKRRKGGKQSVDVVRYCVDSAKCKPRKRTGK